MKFNGFDIDLGSIAKSNDIIKDHILVHFGEEIQNDDWYLKFNSPIKEMDNFIKLTKDKKVLFDIGSQFGAFSYSFIGESKEKKAFAFDPGINPYLISSEIKIINDIKNFNVFNFFIGDKNEVVNCSNENLQSLLLQGTDTRLMLSVDMIVALFKTIPDVMKIDIEGSEYTALLGAYSTIMTYKPIIFIEVHPNFLKNYGNNIEEVVKFVESINYKIYDLDGSEVTDYLDILRKEKTDSNRTVWVHNE